MARVQKSYFLASCNFWRKVFCKYVSTLPTNPKNRND